jgi:hypothetical protein
VLVTAEIEVMGSMVDGTLPGAFLNFARAHRTHRPHSHPWHRHLP